MTTKRTTKTSANTMSKSTDSERARERESQTNKGSAGHNPFGKPAGSPLERRRAIAPGSIGRLEAVALGSDRRQPSRLSCAEPNGHKTQLDDSIALSWPLHLGQLFICQLLIHKTNSSCRLAPHLPANSPAPAPALPPPTVVTPTPEAAAFVPLLAAAVFL